MLPVLPLVPLDVIDAVLCRIERSPRAAKSAGDVSTSALARCIILTASDRGLTEL
jgi:hypothetical protein